MHPPILPVPDPGDLLAYAPLITGQPAAGTLIVLTARDAQFDAGIHIPAGSHTTLKDVISNFGSRHVLDDAYQLAVLAYDTPVKETPSIVAAVSALRNACQTAGVYLAGAWQTHDRDWASLLTQDAYGPATGSALSTGFHRVARLLTRNTPAPNRCPDHASAGVTAAWKELATHLRLDTERPGRLTTTNQMTYLRLRATAEDSLRTAYLRSARDETPVTVSRGELPLVLLMLHDTHVLLTALSPLARMTQTELRHAYTGWIRAAAACPPEGIAPAATLAAASAWLAGHTVAASTAAATAVNADQGHVLAQLIVKRVNAGRPATELKSGLVCLAAIPGSGKLARELARPG